MRIAKKQRAKDIALPLGQRVGIGGEVCALHMTPAGMSILRAHRFDDYDAQYREVCAQLWPLSCRQVLRRVGTTACGRTQIAEILKIDLFVTEGDNYSLHYLVLGTQKWVPFSLSRRISGVMFLQREF